MAWKLKEYERAMYKVIDIVDGNGEVIKTFVADDLDYSRKKKQAKLMAAAPELLDKAEEIVMEIGHYGFASKSTLMALESLIKKIKGDD